MVCIGETFILFSSPVRVPDVRPRKAAHALVDIERTLNPPWMSTFSAALLNDIVFGCFVECFLLGIEKIKSFSFVIACNKIEIPQRSIEAVVIVIEHFDFVMGWLG
jgi:hypothetical protein